MDGADEGKAGVPAALGYATPKGKSRVGPSAVVMLTGLGLGFLGGCFLIGVLMMNHPGFGPGGVPVPPPALTAGEIMLEVILYGLAFASFGGAVFLIGLGVKWLAGAVK